MTVSVEGKGVSLDKDAYEAAYGSTVSLKATVSAKPESNAVDDSDAVVAAAPNTVDFYLGDLKDGHKLNKEGGIVVKDGVATLPGVAWSGDDWAVKNSPSVITAVFGGSDLPVEGSGGATLKVTAIRLPEPTDLALTSAEPGKVTVTWKAVEHASGYSVQLVKNGGPQGKAAVVGATDELTHTFGITDSGTYTVNVTAMGAGNYADSEAAISSSLTFHRVSFDLNGGEGSIPSQFVAQNGKVTEPESPTSGGRRFLGWRTSNAESDWDSANNTVTGSLTLTARWQLIPSTPSAPVVDQSGLREAVEAAGKLSEADCTAARWQPFGKALESAEPVLDEGPVSQSRVDETVETSQSSQSDLVKLTDVQGRFSDVSSSSPFHGEVWTLAGWDVIRGYGDGTFQGMADVKRQDFAAFLYRLAGEPEFDADEVPEFEDVDSDTPHRTAVLWARSAGVSNGFDDGSFGMGRDILRQDTAVMLCRLRLAVDIPSPYQ